MPRQKVTDTNIITNLSQHPQSCKELAALLGMNHRQIERRLRALVLNGTVTKKRWLRGDGRTPVYGVVSTMVY